MELLAKLDLYGVMIVTFQCTANEVKRYADFTKKNNDNH